MANVVGADSTSVFMVAGGRYEPAIERPPLILRDTSAQAID